MPLGAWSAETQSSKTVKVVLSGTNGMRRVAFGGPKGHRTTEPGSSWWVCEKAHLVEQQPPKLSVVGSNPTFETKTQRPGSVTDDKTPNGEAFG